MKLKKSRKIDSPFVGWKKRQEQLSSFNRWEALQNKNNSIEMPNSSKEFNELVLIFKILHSKNGCLWDREQTHESLLKYLKEETGEFIKAVKEKDPHSMQEELGDILLQVMFHSQIAKKEKKFTINDVINTLIQKLKRRHPHVFSNTKVKSVNEIVANWEKIKRKEKRSKTRRRN